jgi:parvulin-like peptidyl-prolyl isomerase
VRSPSRCIPALGAVLFALAVVAGCGGVPSDAVVSVAGKPITKSTFTHWLGVAAAATSATGEAAPSKPVIPEPASYKACIAHLEATQPKPAKGAAAPTPAQLKSQCETQFKSLQQEVLGFLISSAWVLGEGESLGVKVSDSEVKKRFTQIKEQQFPKPAEFEKFLASSGQSVSDLLLRVKLNLLSSKIQQKIIKSKSNVSQAQIAKYYNEHKSRFEVPEKRAVNVILTKTEAQAAKAKAEVSSGKSFASVAKSASIDPVSKARGGLLPEVVKGQEEQALSNAIFAAKANALSGPVKTPFGYYVFEVKSVKPGSVQTLAQAQSSVKSQLVATNQQAALSSFVKNFKKKWMAKTECAANYNGVPIATVIQDCKQYKAPKTGGLK